jgi:hypothetical protein
METMNLSVLSLFSTYHFSARDMAMHKVPMGAEVGDINFQGRHQSSQAD